MPYVTSQTHGVIFDVRDKPPPNYWPDPVRYRSPAKNVGTRKTLGDITEYNVILAGTGVRGVTVRAPSARRRARVVRGALGACCASCALPGTGRCAQAGLGALPGLQNLALPGRVVGGGPPGTPPGQAAPLAPGQPGNSIPGAMPGSPGSIVPASGPNWLLIGALGLGAFLIIRRLRRGSAPAPAPAASTTP